MDDYILLESGATRVATNDPEPVSTSDATRNSYPLRPYPNSIDDQKAEEVPYEGGKPEPEPIRMSIQHVSTITVIVSIGVLLVMILIGWIVYRVRVRPTRQGRKVWSGCLGARQRQGEGDLENNTGMPRTVYLEPTRKRPSLDRRGSAATTSTLVSTNSTKKEPPARPASLYLHPSKQASSIHLHTGPNAVVCPFMSARYPLIRPSSPI
jgi:hypothetical protein